MIHLIPIKFASDEDTPTKTYAQMSVAKAAVSTASLALNLLMKLFIARLLNIEVIKHVLILPVFVVLKSLYAFMTSAW